VSRAAQEVEQGLNSVCELCHVYDCLKDFGQYDVAY